jgi:signal transduction histidine kinase
MMYQTAIELENQSNRAIMPGIVAILAALIFTFIFTYLINYYIVSPILRITDRINQFKERRLPYDVKIETNDEILHLSEAIEHLCVSVKMLDIKK